MRDSKCTKVGVVFALFLFVFFSSVVPQNKGQKE